MRARRRNGHGGCEARRGARALSPTSVIAVASPLLAFLLGGRGLVVCRAWAGTRSVRPFLLAGSVAAYPRAARDRAAARLAGRRSRVLVIALVWDRAGGRRAVSRRRTIRAAALRRHPDVVERSDFGRAATSTRPRSCGLDGVSEPTTLVRVASTRVADSASAEHATPGEGHRTAAALGLLHDGMALCVRGIR